MHPVRFVAATLVLLVLAGCGRDDHPSAPAPATDLASAVAGARTRHRLPAMAAAVIEADSLRVAVDGVRRTGTPGAVTEADLFHVGSNTKAVVASAIGRLVEQGTLRWSLTLAEAFPELGDTLDAGLRGVTLAQLLRHRAGLQPFEELPEFDVLPPFAGDGVAQRRAFARWLLARPPASAVGGYRYSNAGYGVAAAIAEQATGQSWEQIVRTRVLDAVPAATFAGWPLEHDAAQPWGHVQDGSGALVAVPPSFGSVPEVIAPAGDLSFSIRDYARFVQLHLRAMLGRPQVLADSTFDVLHEPVGEYAMGWAPVSLGGRAMLMHDGSAGTFYAFVLLDPARQRAYALFTNAAATGVDSAFTEVLDSQGVLAPAAAVAALRARSGPAPRGTVVRAR